MFDCSVEYQGHNLNSKLLSGPDFINNLAGVLLRFRVDVALTCDIQSMFHQVGVREPDRDYLWFLWWDDGNLNKEPSDYRMTVHLFGATSSPACANYALKYAADQCDSENSKASNFIRSNFYVDDGLTSVKSVNEAVELIGESRQLCLNSGFNLTKFVSSNKEGIDKIPIEIRTKPIQNIDLTRDMLPIEYALGVQWCIESDSFKYNIRLSDKPYTRRGLLSTISSIFDPLGIVSPFLLTGKALLQELCRDGKDWDEPIPADIHACWDKWRYDLLELSKLEIPRCYKPPEFGEVKSAQLHHFSDASQVGYGQ